MNERKNERMFLVKKANERTNESTNERRRERWWYNHRVVGSHSIRLVHFHQIHSIVSILEHSLATTFARWIETKEKSTYSNDSPGKLIPKSATTTNTYRLLYFGQMKPKAALFHRTVCTPYTLHTNSTSVVRWKCGKRNGIFNTKRL